MEIIFGIIIFLGLIVVVYAIRQEHKPAKENNAPISLAPNEINPTAAAIQQEPPRSVQSNPFEQSQSFTDASITDESGLKNIANFVLIGGILSSIIMFFSLGIVTVPKSLYSNQAETTFSGYGFAISLGVLLSSIASYYFLNVIANISISLKKIATQKQG